MKIHLLLTSLLAVILLSSCSQDEPAMTGNDDGSRTEDAAIKYDTRFAVPVYTDADGYMHLDIDFDSFKYPGSEKLAACLKGKAWQLEMNYDYRVYSDEKGVPKAELEENPFFNILGGYVQPKFQIVDESNAKLYDRVFKWDDPAVYTDVIKPIKYSYDEKTGTLNLHYLHYWRVVLVNESELWLAGKGPSDIKNVDNFTLYKLVSVSAETVAEWNKTFKAI